MKSIKNYMVLLFVGIMMMFNYAGGMVFTETGEMVIGWQDPNELDTITGNFYFFDDVYILNNGTLELSQANFNIAGNIYVIGDGQLIVRDSTLTVMNAQDFQYYLMALENAEVTFENSVLSTNGFSSHLYVRNEASVDILNSNLPTDSYSWLIAYFLDDTSLNVVDSEFPKEIIPEDRADIQVSNPNLTASSLSIWLNFHYNVNAELHGLNSPFELSQVQISPEDPNISGIDYSIDVDDAYIYWNLNVGYFSNVQVYDSAVSLSLFLHGYDGIDFVNIAPGHFSDMQLPLYEFERVIHLHDSSIIYWQLYLAGLGNEWSETYRIVDSEINELIVFDETFVRLRNSMTGPAVLGSLYDGQLHISDSIIKSKQVVGFNDSMITLEACILEGTPIIAADNSIVNLNNPQMALNSDNPFLPMDAEVTLEAFGAGRIYLAQIDAVEQAVEMGQTVTIMGSADMVVGKDSQIHFDHYNLEYSLSGSDVWQPIDVEYTESVRQDQLHQWDTSQLTEPGEYLLRLNVVDTNGQSLHSFGAVTIQ
jgi:hypothetical protein